MVLLSMYRKVLVARRGGFIVLSSSHQNNGLFPLQFLYTLLAHVLQLSYPLCFFVPAVTTGKAVKVIPSKKKL